MKKAILAIKVWHILVYEALTVDLLAIKLRDLFKRPCKSLIYDLTCNTIEIDRKRKVTFSRHEIGLNYTLHYVMHEA
jgi:hypothetical protein